MLIPLQSYKSLSDTYIELSFSTSQAFYIASALPRLVLNRIKYIQLCCSYIYLTSLIVTWYSKDKRIVKAVYQMIKNEEDVLKLILKFKSVPLFTQARHRAMGIYRKVKHFNADINKYSIALKELELEAQLVDNVKQYPTHLIKLVHTLKSHKNYKEAAEGCERLIKQGKFTQEHYEGLTTLLERLKG